MRKEQMLAKLRTEGSTAGQISAGRSTKTTPQSPHKGKSGSPAQADEDGANDTWSLSQFKVPPVEEHTRFHDFELPDQLMHAISDLGFEYCTPIQAQILPSTLNGKDATGRAQTGTGKTAAFLISVFSRMLWKPIEGKRKSGTPRILILAPTRELVMQISEEAWELSKHCGFNIISVFGGMDYVKQQKLLGGKPVDIVVATPGRLLDFQRRGDISLRKVETLIIDEADRMLDMGFIPDVRKIIQSTPPKDKRQTLLFSATLTHEITRLSAQWTKDPVVVEIEPEQVAVETVDQIIYIVTMDEKFGLLYNVIEKQSLDRILIFCNRKDEVRRLTERLTRYGINSQMISGDVPQKQRMSRLEAFKAGKIRVLVATDVAGRGIHIEGMNHVINYTIPRDPEDYVHRIGRTGRAGSLGTSISFADEEDAFYIPAIEEYLGRKLDCIEPPDEWLVMPEAPPRSKKQKSSAKSNTADGRGQKSGSTTRSRRRRRYPKQRSDS